MVAVPSIICSLNSVLSSSQRPARAKMIFKLCVLCCLWLAAVNGQDHGNNKSEEKITVRSTTSQLSNTSPTIKGDFERLFAKANLIPLLVFGLSVTLVTLLVFVCVLSACRCLAARRRRGSGVFEVQMVDIREAGNLMAETGSAHDIEKENPPPCGANGITILPATGRAAEGAGEPEPGGGGGGIYELVDEVQEHAGGAPGAATTPAAADDGLTMVDNELYRSVGEAHQRGAVVEAAGAGAKEPVPACATVASA
ncbi:uncharacterized protein LOC133355758 [Lethenteron reissneri]|uniref:uncharacterized protein LOC133355758 n=1 Tax=Lethenteron reissneri TaxID=7753 RepID=UPI002AB7CCE8|nr:uncharacterized protein LOC133355758 [Lethenteron reissneri]